MSTKWDWGRSRDLPGLEVAEAAEVAPPGIDISKPSQARIYDVLLGGKDNFASDREAAELIVAGAPDAPAAARENRAFLGRAVRHCIRQGIHQFLDIGTGLPTQGNVHEVALPLIPDAHVAYVDNDPIVLAHARALLAPTGGTRVIQADLRDPEAVAGHPSVRELIDFEQPVAVLLVAVLNFLRDEEAQHAVDLFRELMAPGSHLVISHISADNAPERGEVAKEGWRQTGTGLHFRDHATVEHYFDGFELVEPGVVWVPEWHPIDEDAAGYAPRWAYAGVGRKPAAHN